MLGVNKYVISENAIFVIICDIICGSYFLARPLEGAWAAGNLPHRNAEVPPVSTCFDPSFCFLSVLEKKLGSGDKGLARPAQQNKTTSPLILDKLL